MSKRKRADGDPPAPPAPCERLRSARDVARPLHERITILAELLADVAQALTARVVLAGFDKADVVQTQKALRLEPRAYKVLHIDEQVKKPVSMMALMQLLYMRVDLMQNEVTWRHQQEQKTARDLLGDTNADTFLGGGAATREPVVFVSLRDLRFLLAKIQRHVNAAAQWAPLLEHLKRRAAILTAFAFPRETMDVPEWTTAVNNDLYVTNLAAAYELAITFDALDREFDADTALTGHLELCRRRHDSVETLNRIGSHVLHKVHGDQLATMYATDYAEAHVRIGWREMFAGRQSQHSNPSSLRLVNEFAGRELANKIRKHTDRPLLDIFRSAIQKCPILSAVLCRYYATQCRLPVPRLRFAVASKAWYTVEGDTDAPQALHATVEDALACFVRRRWPLTTLSALGVVTAVGVAEPVGKVADEGHDVDVQRN